MTDHLAGGSNSQPTEQEGAAVESLGEQLWKLAEEQAAARAAAMPDEQSALLAMFSAYQRLRELGWREAIYCPKDGSYFDAIEAGSTGIHDCCYAGEWPKGGWWVASDNDLWPSHPILFRPRTTADDSRDALPITRSSNEQSPDEARDAARYRWLRDETLTNRATTIAMWEASTGLELDAAIDTAIAEQDGKGGERG